MKEERLYFLRRMNAWTPPAPPVARIKPTTPAGPRDRNARRPATMMFQGAAHRYRLRYAKLGRTIYLGHLDLIRHLPRIFRRAGVELHYSEGFHPKPELSFGPALGLGTPSLGEILDVKISEELEPTSLVERLNEVTLEGISFLGAARLYEGDRNLGRVLTMAEYVAVLPEPTDVDRAVARFASGEPLSLLRAGSSEHGRPKLGRTVDVRKTVVRVARVGAALGVELRRQLALKPGGGLCTWTASLSAEGGARPVEVIGALVDESCADAASFVRVALHGGGPAGIDPLDLAALRAWWDQQQAVALAARAAQATAEPISV
jgi:radical SAM-linked protein